MIKEEQKIQLMASIVILLVVGVLAMGVYSANAKKKDNEIKTIQEYIEAGTFDKTDVNRLETKKAKEFAEDALEKYEKMIEEYPEPTIELLNIHEEIDGEDGEFIFEHQEGSENCLIEFKGMDVEHVFVDERGFWNKEDTKEVLNDNGIYSYLVPLRNMENTIQIVLKNKYKEFSIKVHISRNENVQEKNSRLAGERRQTEWDNSKAGRLCKKHPSWGKIDCIKIADNEIWVGMSYDMLKERRGLPNSATPSDYGYGIQWQWCWWNYTPSCFYDEDGDGYTDSYN